MKYVMHLFSIKTRFAFFVSLTSILVLFPSISSFSQELNRTAGLAKTVKATDAEPKPVAKSVRPSRVKGLLFEVRLPELKQPMNGQKKTRTVAYLFGSIHVAKADFYPMSIPVQVAYKQANTVVVEADVSNTQATKAIIDKLSYTAPDKLENHLSPATWSVLTAMAGSSIEQFQNYKPVMVAMGLTISVGMKLGFDPSKGIDLHYIQQSKQDKKQLVELEGVEFQADVLASLSDEEGNAMLASTLESFRQGTAPKELNRIVSSWKSADAEGLATVLLEAGNKDEGSLKLMKGLMDDRNEGMAQKIQIMMSEGKKLFVVIGAGHFAGENSILDKLRKQGLQVKQIH